MSEREGTEMETVVDAKSARTELGPAGGGDITIRLERKAVTWTREEAAAVHEALGRLLAE